MLVEPTFPLFFVVMSNDIFTLQKAFFTKNHLRKSNIPLIQVIR